MRKPAIGRVVGYLPALDRLSWLLLPIALTAKAKKSKQQLKVTAPKESI